VDEWHDKADHFEKMALENKERAETAEAEALAVQNKLILAETSMDKAEGRNEELTAKVQEYEKQTDEQEQELKKLRIRISEADNNEEVAQFRMKEATMLLKQTDMKYEQAVRKTVALESDLEKAEERADFFEKKAGKLEQEINSLGNNVKSLRQMVEKHEVELEAKERLIGRLEEELKEETNRADEASIEVSKLEKDIDELETNFITERESFAKAQLELREMMRELTDD